MPFKIAKDRNIYIPQKYFTSRKQMEEVLQYEGDCDLYVSNCFKHISMYPIIIMKGGGAFRASFETNIKISECTHIDEIIGSRSIGEL